jgi:hypothetical protein
MKFLPLLLLLAAPAPAAELRARSGQAKAHLLELYSSEGCSSCPPADAWFSSLRRDPALWSGVVPVVFHVDYWDGLGWPDALADAAWTARQRAYAASWGTGTVYTPGVVLDGAEYRGWGSAAPAPGADAGVLDAREKDGTVSATFSPATDDGPYELYAARLGAALESKVTRGENAGKTLRHDFVALALARAPLKKGKAGWRGAVVLPAAKVRAPREGLAVWVVDRRGRPVQAAGALP